MLRYIIEKVLGLVIKGPTGHRCKLNYIDIIISDYHAVRYTSNLQYDLICYINAIVSSGFWSHPTLIRGCQKVS
jgi:hypothetical protein